MDDACGVLVELNERAWTMLKDSLADVSDDEASWRPHPLGNNIDVIVRHLRIEATWHRDSLIHGTVMPFELTPSLQASIDAVPLDFRGNLAALEQLVVEFIDGLRSKSADAVAADTDAVYGAAFSAQRGRHFLGYHQAMHLTAHCGQIRTIRNLYGKSRGELGRFYPDNPTFPATAPSAVANAPAR